MSVRFPVGGPRQPVLDHMRSLGFTMSPWSDKVWTRDGVEARIFGSGSMVCLGTEEFPLDDLAARLKDKQPCDGICGAWPHCPCADAQEDDEPPRSGASEESK